MSTRFPPKKTVLRVLKHLEEDLGLSVYGGVTDLETGEEKPACMDYSPEDVIKYRELLRKGKLWTEGEG